MIDDNLEIHDEDESPADAPTTEPPKREAGIGAVATKHASNKKKRRWLPAFWYRLDKRRKIFLASALVLILLMAIVAAYVNTIGKTKGGIEVNKSKAAQSTVASPLTGLRVKPDLAKRPVTGVMIENSQDARPQSGLQEAGVVFEAIAEGGITRFIAFFQEAQPSYVGPVRSVRPYYLDFAGSFDASIAHVGGSPDALSQIRNGGKDLDQFFNASTYWRVNSRPSPHDVYTSFERLDALNKAKGYTSSTFSSWARKNDQKLATPTAKTIEIPISSSLFNVHYDYDAGTNTYQRYEGGAVHVATSSEGDKTGTPLHPKVVITPIMSYSIVDDSGHSGYGATGSGPVYVFQDGGVTQGTWSKADRNSQYIFKDSAGNTIKLNTGQVWVTAVQDGQVSYAP